jgi:hypothetical protein
VRRQALPRVELRPDAIEAPGVSMQQPAEVWRAHGDFIPVGRQMEMEGLGSATQTGTTREEYRAAAAPEAVYHHAIAGPPGPVDRGSDASSGRTSTAVVTPADAGSPSRRR